MATKKFLDDTGLTHFWAAIKSALGAKQDIVDYTTAEQDTGIKWVDGSTIYQKTVNLGTLPNATTKNVAHNISNLKAIIKLETIATNGTTYASLPFVNTSAVASNINVNANGTNIVIMTGTNRTTWSAYTTVYYTKTS